MKELLIMLIDAVASKHEKDPRGRKAILYEFDPKKYNNYSKTGF